MYAYIKGDFAVKEPAYVVIDVGGIGYQIRISLNTYSAIKSAASGKLYTYFHVKEDAHALYGFYENLEKEIFLHLISISGVGPGTALMILSSLTPAELQEAIINEDAKLIQRVKGVGAKTAQRIILELKDRMKREDLAGKPQFLTSVSHNTKRYEALTALTTLGINKATAEKAIDTILKKTNDNITLEDLIKQALKSS